MVINPIDELNSTVKKVADDTLNDPLCKDIINELLSKCTFSPSVDTNLSVPRANFSF